MGIFKKRYLLLINTLLIFTSVICALLIPIAKLTVALIAVLAFMVIGVLYIAKRSHKVISLVGAICCIAIFLSAFSSYIFFDVHCKNQKAYADKTLLIKATVLEQEYATDNLCGYKIRVEGISGVEESVRFKSRLDCMYVSELIAGDVIFINAHSSLIDDDLNGYNVRRDMQSEGICLSFTSYEESDYIKSDEDGNKISAFCESLNFDCAYNLKTLILGEEGRLASALLLGNKYDLSDETTRDFSRAGVSHILALSGMHMSIIMGGIAYLLKKLRVRRIPRAAFLIITSLFYLALTGFSVSATRSVLMLLCVYLSMILSYKSDTLTSLSVAGAMIILLSPGAVLDISFWMSYAATFGIVVFMPLYDEGFEAIFKKQKRGLVLKRAIKALFGLVFAGTFALIGLSTVLCVFTKEYSKYSLISSVLLSLPTAALILISAIMPIFANIPCVGALLVDSSRAIARFMLDFCADISKKEDVLFVFNYEFIGYFAILIAIAFFVSVAIKFKKKWIAPIIPVIAITLLITNVCVYNVNHKNDIDMIYKNISSQGDVIVISKNNEAIICDLSQGSNNALSAGANLVRLSNCSEISALMLTDLNSYHISSTSKFFKSQRVREVWVPYPDNEDEYYILKAVKKNAEACGVSVKIYENQSQLIAFGDVKITPDSLAIDRSSVPVMLLDFENNGKHIVYASAAYSEREDIENTVRLIKDANVLIVGARGPKVKEKYGIFDNNAIEEIIICDIDRAIYLDTKDISNNIPIYIGKEYKSIDFCN